MTTPLTKSKTSHTPKTRVSSSDPVKTTKRMLEKGPEVEDVSEDRRPGGTAGLWPPPVDDWGLTDGPLMSRSHRSKSTSPMSDDGSECSSDGLPPILCCWTWPATWWWWWCKPVKTTVVAMPLVKDGGCIKPVDGCCGVDPP